MSGFVVYGVPAGKVEAMVMRRVTAQEVRLKNPPKPGSTERRMAKHMERLRQRPPRERLSPEYDAPQFCEEWMELAKKSGFHSMVIVAPGERL